MISREQVQELLYDLESDRVERTTSTNNTEKFSQAVCAFANDLPNHRQPGYLLIGVNDDGSLSGLKVTDALLRNLAGLRSDGNIQPLPVLIIERYSFPDGDVAVVEVAPSDLPPVRYNGRVWIRVGPRKAVASEQEERILVEKRAARAHSFDASPVQGSSEDDLSLALFASYREQVIDPDVIAENHRSIPYQLASLRFFDAITMRPTVAGILLFGKNPRFFLPGVYVQYLLLPGTELVDVPTEQAEVSGDLLSVLREMDSRIRTSISIGLKSASILTEESVRSYPEAALREIFLNAIMHRDYMSNTPVRFYVFSDRIEIQNPGGLFGEVTRDTLTERNSYRNPIIAEAMKNLGYVNRFGYGIQRAESALSKNGNPPLEFEIDDRSFLVKIRRRQP